jgi:hypothetical protein
MPQAVTGRGCLLRGPGGEGAERGVFSPTPRLLTPRHGLNNYKDTKPEMSSLLVFNRVYRLEIWYFRPAL